MTIKVEHEVLVSLESPQWPSSAGCNGCLVFPRQPIGPQQDFAPTVEKLRLAVSFEDDDSVYTASTASLSDTDSELERRVSFAEDLVTEEWTRPYTPQEEISNLFYSTEETQRYVESGTNSTGNQTALTILAILWSTVLLHDS
jgi:hypothetical protein